MEHLFRAAEMLLKVCRLAIPKYVEELLRLFLGES